MHYRSKPPLAGILLAALALLAAAALVLGLTHATAQAPWSKRAPPKSIWEKWRSGEDRGKTWPARPRDPARPEPFKPLPPTADTTHRW